MDCRYCGNIRHRRHAYGRRSYNGTTLGTGTASLCGNGIEWNPNDVSSLPRPSPTGYSRLSSRPSSDFDGCARLCFITCGNAIMWSQPCVAGGHLVRNPSWVRYAGLTHGSSQSHMIKHITGSTWRQKSGIFDLGHHRAKRGHAKHDTVKRGAPEDRVGCIGMCVGAGVDMSVVEHAGSCRK